MLQLIIKLFRSPFVHPLQNRAPLPARTPQDVVRNEHKAAILQARISAFFERFNPTPVVVTAEAHPDYRVGSCDPIYRVENFINFATERVDVAFYKAGL